MSVVGWRPCAWCGYFVAYENQYICPRCQDVLRAAGVTQRTPEEAQAAGKTICEAEGKRP